MTTDFKADKLSSQSPARSQTSSAGAENVPESLSGLEQLQSSLQRIIGNQGLAARSAPPKPPSKSAPIDAINRIVQRALHNSGSARPQESGANAELFFRTLPDRSNIIQRFNGNDEDKKRALAHQRMKPLPALPQGGGAQPAPAPVAPQGGGAQSKPAPVAAQQGGAQPAPQPAAPKPGLTRDAAAVVNAAAGQELVIPAVSISVPDIASKDSASEGAEIASITARIKTTYGIELDNKAGVKAANLAYAQTEHLNVFNLVGVDWTLMELKALENVLREYAPILGAARQQSTMAPAQSLTTISRVDIGMDRGASGGALKSATTQGETFSKSGNVSIYNAALMGDSIFGGDIPISLRRVLAHELNHALNQPAYMGSFLRAFGDFWRDPTTCVLMQGAAPHPGLEAPITMYGMKNAAEDFAETAGIFFTDRFTLELGNSDINPTFTPGMPGNPAPRRIAFMERIVAEWTSQPIKAYGKATDDFYMAVNEGTQFNFVKFTMDRVKDAYAALSASEKVKIHDYDQQLNERYIAFMSALLNPPPII